jgi:hypothetical protein
MIVATSDIEVVSISRTIIRMGFLRIKSVGRMSNGISDRVCGLSVRFAMRSGLRARPGR